jgi:hypothetical protein
MSDNTTTIASQDTQVGNDKVTSNIVNEYPSTVSVKSNEYAIVGDGLFATTKEEVPTWMRELVGDLVRSATVNTYNAMEGFNYNLYNALLSLQVAENKYQQAINTRVTDQEAFVQAVETLNSTAQNAISELINVRQTYATKDFAITTAANVLEASISGGAIKSSLGALASSMTNQYGTMSQRMDVLESTFENLNYGVSGYANITNTLETYVGVTDGVPNGTGLLAKVTSYYAVEQNSAPATDKLWLDSSSSTKILKKYDTDWVYITVKDGDTVTALNTKDNDIRVYVYRSGTWITETPAGIISSSKVVTTLKADLYGDGDNINSSTSLKNTLLGSISSEGARVESKFAYNSSLILNGVPHNSGFGLATSIDSNSIPAGSSEFWVNAEKLKFTNSNKTGVVTPFTIDTSGTTPQITFNGIVDFNGLANKPPLVHTPDEVIKALNNGNTTKIDGGSIMTGSITADKIDVNSIRLSGDKGIFINKNGIFIEDGHGKLRVAIGNLDVASSGAYKQYSGGIYS